jgi:hypothetical protein
VPNNSLVDIARRNALYAGMEHQAPQQKPFASDRSALLNGLASTLAFVPGVGDLAGLAADADMYATDPSSRTLGNGLLSLAALVPGIPGVKVFRAGAKEGRTAAKGGPTFYSTTAKGAEPYGTPSEYTINPGSVFDTTNIEHRRLYDRFLEETGNPARYGGNYPFWTAETDLKKWLDAKGHNFDAIMFGENTGIPSYAVYK